MPGPTLMNRIQTAKALGVSRQTLYSWVRSHRAPPSIRIGKRRYWTQEIIDTWAKALNFYE